VEEELGGKRERDYREERQELQKIGRGRGREEKIPAW
jgi:hypothetical protein